MAIESSGNKSGSVSIFVMVAENGYVIRESDDHRGGMSPAKQHVARTDEELVYILADLCGVCINTLEVCE